VKGQRVVASKPPRITTAARHPLPEHIECID
jgi:hypothetical protein